MSESLKKAQKAYRAKKPRTEMVLEAQTKAEFEFFRDCRELTNDQALALLLQEFWGTHAKCRKCGKEGRYYEDIAVAKIVCHDCK